MSPTRADRDFLSGAPLGGRARAGACDHDLVVLSHLRWDWVWQRPQHLIRRLGAGRRTWFVEEPRIGGVSAPELRVEAAPPVTRVWLEVPESFAAPTAPGIAATGARVEFRDIPAAVHLGFLTALLGGSPRDVWLYAPTAVDLAEALHPRLLVYDVMDDLANFADAPPEMELRMHRALAVADVVFTGGRSLHRSTVAVRDPRRTHLFPSGVECEHYARSRELRVPHRRPVVGYVGVLDERLDLPLIASLAAKLPDWQVRLVGPTTKIDPATLPQVPNIEYLGMQPYSALPDVMAGFDVAMMPFARNAATRSISPTKTLEYLAAGLPVVSTRIPDVVADWSTVVQLADDAAEFAAACRLALVESADDRDSRVAPLRDRYEWDNIAAAMARILAGAADGDRGDDAAGAGKVGETSPASRAGQGVHGGHAGHAGHEDHQGHQGIA